MKKLFTICAAILAAMSMSAAVTNMTCAEAAAAAALLEHNVPGTDSVKITGYITNTDGKISKGQQVFWMDDEKGSKKTFEAYWCNLPQECIDNNQPLNVGDKVAITGVLMRYNSTYEMKNGAVEILERAIVKVDTIPATVCEAIEEGEALADGDNTQDVFDIVDVVATTPTQNDTYHTQTFYMNCTDSTKLQIYNCTVHGDYVALNDTVHVWGKLKKYGTQVELVGEIEFVAKGQAIDTTDITVAQALEYGAKLDSAAYSKEVYAVTGYVTKIASAYNEQYKNMSFYMCDALSDSVYQFEAYRIKVTEPVVVGSKVRVAGMLKNYVKDGKSTIEIENTDVEVLTAAKEIANLNPAKIPFNNETYFLVNADNSQNDEGDFYAVSVAIAHPLTAGDFFYTKEDDYANDATYVWQRVGGSLDKTLANQIGFVRGSYDNTRLTMECVLTKADMSNIYHFTMDTDPSTALEKVVFENSNTQKMIINGQLYIVRDGAIYNMMGAQVK